MKAVNENMKIKSGSKIKKVNVAIPKNFTSEIIPAMYNAISTFFNLWITEK